jgi:acetolactate synthase-1/2/3 large subunit
MWGTYTGRFDCGAGAIEVERMPYFPEHILASLAGVQHLILVGAQAPASFFAYRTTPSRLVPEGCQVHTLARIEENALDALQQLAEHLGASTSTAKCFARAELALPSGEMSTRNMIQAIAATLPDQAIVATDSGLGNAAQPACQNAAPHTWLSLTGGSIGQGSPVSTGAALACPQRRVLALLGDGGAAYTIQSLWTQAREQLNVTTVIFANRKYNILNVEYARLGVTEVGPIAASLFDIGNPDIDSEHWERLMHYMNKDNRYLVQAKYKEKGETIEDAVICFKHKDVYCSVEKYAESPYHNWYMVPEYITNVREIISDEQLLKN